MVMKFKQCMIDAIARHIIRITYFLPLTFAGALLIPLTAMAFPNTKLCSDTHLHITHTQNILRPLQQHQEQLQENVRTIYQKLFDCQARTVLSRAQQKQCSNLQKEGPTQFQVLIKAITLRHETSQQLADQTRHAQLVCPAVVEDTLPKVASLEHS
jgi:hypothetical protein